MREEGARREQFRRGVDPEVGRIGRWRTVDSGRGRRADRGGAGAVGPAGTGAVVVIVPRVGVGFDLRCARLGHIMPGFTMGWVGTMVRVVPRVVGMSRVSRMGRIESLATRIMAVGMRPDLYRCGLDKKVVMGTIVHPPDVDGPAGEERCERKDPDGAAACAEPGSGPEAPEDPCRKEIVHHRVSRPQMSRHSMDRARRGTSRPLRRATRAPSRSKSYSSEGALRILSVPTGEPGFRIRPAPAKTRTFPPQTHLNSREAS